MVVFLFPRIGAFVGETTSLATIIIILVVILFGIATKEARDFKKHRKFEKRLNDIFDK